MEPNFTLGTIKLANYKIFLLCSHIFLEHSGLYEKKSHKLIFVCFEIYSGLFDGHRCRLRNFMNDPLCRP